MLLSPLFQLAGTIQLPAPTVVKKITTGAPEVVVTDHVSLTPPTVTVVATAVLLEGLEVRRTARVWPFVIVPDAPHAPPLIETCGLPCPLTETLTGPSYPAGVMLADVASVLSCTFVWSVKLKASGVTS